MLRHAPSGVPLDVTLAWLPFEQEAIRAGEECDFDIPRIKRVVREFAEALEDPGLAEALESLLRKAGLG